MTEDVSGGQEQPSEAGRLAEQSTEAFRAANSSHDAGFKAQKLDEAQSLAADSALAAAYTHLQKAVGLIAFLLPFVVAIGNFPFDGIGLKGSISAYYYTPMGRVFVGSLCALGVFFLSYNYRPLPKFELDNTLSTFACIAAVGVAFLPTASNAVTASGDEKVVAFVHLLCAGSLFALLAIFSLFLFTKTDSAGTPTPEKAQRNRLYRTCGGIIVGSCLLVVVSNLVRPPRAWHALFWLESIGVVAFGVSWLVKGGFLGILADPKPDAGTGAGLNHVDIVDP
jgi:hypothetical protein